MLRVVSSLYALGVMGPTVNPTDTERVGSHRRLLNNSDPSKVLYAVASSLEQV